MYGVVQSINTDASALRIVISDDALSIIKSHTEFYSSPEHSPQNSDILVDTDGKGYINYLENLVWHDDTENVDIARLIKHKEQVMAAATKYIKDQKIWSKYYWLCIYHNYFCNTVQNHRYFTNNAYIPDNFFRREPSKLIG